MKITCIPLVYEALTKTKQFIIHTQQVKCLVLEQMVERVSNMRVSPKDYIIPPSIFSLKCAM